MVPILSLWAPILIGAVLVFVSSSVIHMFLSYHAGDWKQLPDEGATMDALRPLNIPAGDYMMPRAGSSKEMNSDEFKAKIEKGPVAMFTVFGPGDMFNMGPQLAMWFLYSVVVGVVAAYLGGRMLGPGAEYLEVFRVTGTTAFCCYAMALPQRSIWFRQNWPATLKSMFDGLIYATLTAGAFGWLWPA